MYVYIYLCVRGNIIQKKLRFCLKGSDRLCKVAELSMQCCGKLLSDLFETYERVINEKIEVGG